MRESVNTGPFFKTLSIVEHVFNTWTPLGKMGKDLKKYLHQLLLKFSAEEKREIVSFLEGESSQTEEFIKHNRRDHEKVLEN